MATSNAPAAVDVNDPHIADEDKFPEAPCPTPRRVVFMKVAENHAAHDHDGGTVILTMVNGQLNNDLHDARLVLASGLDEVLRQYPWKYRSSKASRYYRITIDEVPFSALPPKPEPPQPQFAPAAPPMPPALPIPGVDVPAHEEPASETP